MIMVEIDTAVIENIGTGVDAAERQEARGK